MPHIAKPDAPDFQRFQYEFTRHIRDPKAHARPAGVPARRMRVYNELLYNNLEGFLLACFPILRRILGKRAWGKLVREFFAEHRCHTPFFRQIPDEFVHYLQHTRGLRDTDPPFLLELAHYEWIELVLSVSNQNLDTRHIAADGDWLHARPAFNPVFALLAYHCPVHRIGPRFKPQEPGAAPTYLLVYRDTDFQVRFIELNPVAARLVSLLQPGKLTVKQALGKITRELKHSDSAAVIRGGLDILTGLRDQGAILGTWVP